MEDFLDNLAVTGPVGMCDEDVIEVHHNVSQQDEDLKDVIHHHLEGGQRVGKA
jgi:hypothetical protein